MGIYQKNLEQNMIAQQQENAKQALKSLNACWSLDQIAEQIQTPYAVLVDLIVGMPIDEIILSDVLEKLGVDV
ncbi:hypothetical protein I2F27_06660 [Acinetobacter sp. B5B]|uniref:hypothetical protein n=1 Tax=Acinetobacter TaxID=469 RepID=UPI0018A2E001|nr:MULTISPECIES: hypothetical protein [Acinetobacter]MBF7683006.1 hypothetical protein [Acinetobacter baretiae]MBF7696172.1 hypothetical protein [Acinetobacter rathckeae]